MTALALTLTITWHGVWAVGKYVLTFGAGFVVGTWVALRGFAAGMGRAFGW